MGWSRGESIGVVAHSTGRLTSTQASPETCSPRRNECPSDVYAEHQRFLIQPTTISSSTMSSWASLRSQYIPLHDERIIPPLSFASNPCSPSIIVWFRSGHGLRWRWKPKCSTNIQNQLHQPSTTYPPKTAAGHVAYLCMPGTARSIGPIEA